GGVPASSPIRAPMGRWPGADIDRRIEGDKMIPVHDDMTIEQALRLVVEKYPTNPLMMVPANPARSYYPEGMTLTYEQAGNAIAALAAGYRAAGYGYAHRVGLLLEFWPGHMLHQLAIDALVSCCVPVIPGHRAGELAYLV